MDWIDGGRQRASYRRIARNALLITATLSGVAGCGSDDAPTSETQDGTTTGSATGSSSGTAAETGSTGGATSTSTTESPSTTSGESSGAATTTGSDTVGPTTTATTGPGVRLCGVDEADEAFFELEHQSQPVSRNGQTFTLECGPQGLFMFDFRVELGGFSSADEFVDFAVQANVEGFDIGPGDNFYFVDPYDLYVGCEDVDGGISILNRLILFPPDEIPDLAALDGAAMTLSLTMRTDDGQSVMRVFQGTVLAASGPEWG